MKNLNLPSALTLALTLIFTTAEQSTVYASPHTLEVALQQIESNWHANELLVWVDGSRSGSVEIGQRVAFEAQSKEAGYLSFLYFDEQGSGAVLYAGAGEPVESGGFRYRFPPTGSLEVEGPAGQSTVVAFLSDRAPDTASLGLADGAVAMPVSASAALASRFDQVYAGGQLRVRKRAARFYADLPGERGQAKTRGIALAMLGDSAQTQLLAMAEPEPLTEQALPSQSELSDGDIEDRRFSGNSFDEHLYFATNSHGLSERGKRLLDTWAARLKDPRVSKKLLLIGHTDARGSDENNQLLSERRANAARDYLRQRHGVSEQRLMAKGQGESNPVVPNDGPEMWRQNRRVEFVVY